jgi:hypothetical protein
VSNLTLCATETLPVKKDYNATDMAGYLKRIAREREASTPQPLRDLAQDDFIVRDKAAKSLLSVPQGKPPWDKPAAVLALALHNYKTSPNGWMKRNMAALITRAVEGRRLEDGLLHEVHSLPDVTLRTFEFNPTPRQLEEGDEYSMSLEQAENGHWSEAKLSLAAAREAAAAHLGRRAALRQQSTSD